MRRRRVSGCRASVACRRVAEGLARDMVLTLVAGTDTTMAVLARVMPSLASHPEWLQALSAEQDQLMEVHGEGIDKTVRCAAHPRLFLWPEAAKLYDSDCFCFSIYLTCL